MVEKTKITRSELWSRIYNREAGSRHERAPDPTVEFIDRLVDEEIKSGRYEIIPEKTEQSQENNNPNEVPAWKKGSTPVFLGESKTTIYSDNRKGYFFYGRGNPHDEDDHPVKGPLVGRLIFSADKDNPWGSSYIPCYKREATVIESFIESDNPQKKQCLQEFIKEVHKSLERRHSVEPAFKKLEDVYEHEIYNQSKLANVRNKVAKVFGLDNVKLSKPLKKIEKAVSDKLFGKVKE